MGWRVEEDHERRVKIKETEPAIEISVGRMGEGVEVEEVVCSAAGLDPGSGKALQATDQPSRVGRLTANANL
jgi:hypothetical protein